MAQPAGGDYEVYPDTSKTCTYFGLDRVVPRIYTSAGYPLNLLLPRHRMFIAALALGLYLPIFCFGYAIFGPLIAPLSTIWVVLAGWFWGIRGGLLAGALNFPLHLVLYVALAEPAFEGVFLQPGMYVWLLLGLGAGWVQNLLELTRNRVQALEASEACSRQLLEQAPVGIVVYDGEEILFANAEAARMVGVEELVSRSIIDFVPPESKTQVVEYSQAILKGAEQDPAIARFVRPDGAELVAEVASTRIGHQDQPAILATMRDVSEQVRLEAELHEAKSFLEHLIASSPVVMFRREGNELALTYVSPNVARLHAQKPEELLGEPQERAFARLHPEDRAHVAAQTELALGGEQVEFVYRTRDQSGAYCWKYCVLQHDERQQQPTLLGYILDITAQKRAEEALHDLALHDPLTGLGNRRKFQEEAEFALVLARREGWPAALIYLDVDNFKVINDTLGHEAGDQLLIEISRRLAASLREGDVVARLGDDEFAILLNHADALGAEQAARRVLVSLEKPFTLRGHEIAIEASLGITLYPDDGADVPELLRKADVTMYRAKQGSKYRFYRPELERHSLDRLSLVSDLRKAVQQEELVLYYQPVLNLKENCIAEVEALLRWPHPEKGMISPATFIPLAEESDLIVQLDRWVCCKAMEQVKVWSQQGLRLRMAVNFSPRSFYELVLARWVEECLREVGLEPNLLTLELTERTLADPKLAREVLKRIRNLGVRIALDDFGTGYSSLVYLESLPLDSLKVDLRFVQRIGERPESEAIVRTVIALAHNLGLKALAEGVETQAQLDWLKAEGCDFAQGYLIARPMPPEAAEAWLKVNNVMP